jgi:uncharacterized protein
MNQTSSASLVVEHVVPQGKGWAFRLWQMSITQAARRYKGFLRTDLLPPLKGDCLKWYVIIHFDSPEHLDAWLRSHEREALLAAGQQIIESYKFTSFATGLEGWFSRHAGAEHFGFGPPAWKQILTVVLALYPTVVLQSWGFKQLGWMQSWPPAIAMLVNMLITSSLLTWVVMPNLTRLFKFWLRPSHQATPFKTECLGLGLMAIAFSVMVVLFNHM